ncbi:MAG TPA: thiamine pyridinylase [Thermoanaerobaculia bacterium]|nr:thiamine pyridinylase [Thermoanaerobaculia bacterium]
MKSKSFGLPEKDYEAGARLGRTVALVLSILGSLAASGCTSLRPAPPQPATAAQHAAVTQLTVGLYPYVPRLTQFQQAVKDAWRQVQPGVSLNFLSSSQWDGGYKNDPSTDTDVFVFDAMYFEYFRSKNWLEPLTATEIQGLNDFVPYALQGVQVGSLYYAIPQLGCANLMFYQKTDSALAQANTLTQVNSVLSQCTYTSEIPPDHRGLMIDMSGGTTTASFYLDSEHSITGQYPLPLPWTPSQLDPAAIGNLRSLLAMASYENGTASLDDPYQRSNWFSSGWGRAVVGYSESMSDMSDQTLSTVAFKVMPLSDNANPPLFYADVIGINTSTNQRGTHSLAVQLANVMASTATMIASIGPDSSNPRPQYLMPTRPTIFQALGQTFPLYQRMYGLVTASNPVMFKLDSQSRSWLTAMKAAILSESRADYPCACDYTSQTYISSDSQAQAICQQACAAYGGWNGQWTNTYPAAPQGQSVCGCKTCPVH